jgi:hypothetical protein
MGPAELTSFDADTVARFLRRSYRAVDGLWFMLEEERRGFDHALELDARVWAVVAKIQAREARELTGCAGHAPEELARCFSLKLTADGHRFAVALGPSGVRFRIDECPWLELLRKSNREHLAARVSQAICPTEGRAWCAEFGNRYQFEMAAMACAGAPGCEIAFVRRG